MEPGLPERGRAAAGGVSRAVKAVLAVAGAIVTLTGAVAGIRSLLHHEDGGRDASVSNVSVAGPSSLGAFRLRERVEPAADSGGSPIRLAAADPGVLLAQDVTPTPTPSETATVSPTADPTPSTSPTVTPTVSPTVTPGDVTILCDPGVPAGGTDACPAPRVVDVCLPDAPADSPLRCPEPVAGEQRQALEGSLESTPPAIRRSVNMGLICERDALASGCALSDAGPEPQTRAGRRRAYERIIRGIRSTRVRQGRSGRAIPLGMVVSFDARLRGLAGEDVAVTWTIYTAGAHARLGSDWFADRRAVAWHIETDEDQGSADIWVPLPPRRGRYFARISLRDDSGRRLTYANTPVFR